MSFWKGKKVFITGHTGFKGSWLSIWLNALGAQLTGYALTPPTDPSMYEICNVSRDIKSIIADIRDLERLKSAVVDAKPDIVIHMAAQPIVRESYKSPVETFDVNVMGTVNILEAVRSSESVAAVVNVTTDKVYENPEDKKGFKECEPLGGWDPYSSSKACSEIVTMSYRRSYFNPKHLPKHFTAIASARAGNVIGGGDFAPDRLIPDFIRSILKNEPLVIRSPKAVRPWQHVLEPLSGYLILAEKLYKHGARFAEAWNFGPERSDARPVEWIVRKLCKAWDGASYSISRGRHPHEAGYLYLDISKARKKLSWRPKWDLIVALDKVIEWTRAYRKGEDMLSFSLRQIKEYELLK